MKMSLRLLSIFLLFLPLQAWPCGGPSSYPIADALNSISDLLDQTVTPTDSFGDGYTIPSFLFLYPFHVDPAERQRIEDLWNFSYGDRFQPDGEGEAKPLTFQKLNLEAFTKAIRQGQATAAETEAKKVVEQGLDMPAALAIDNQKDFARALEYLELSPYLSGMPADRIEKFFLPPENPEQTWPSSPQRPWEMISLPVALQQAVLFRSTERQNAGSLAQLFPQSPRAATLRFIALQDKMQREIPNGWIEEIQKKMTPEAWDTLLKQADGWLKDYPQHPLADLVRLTKLRLNYLRGDTDKAWADLLEIYPRRLARILGEMRFLLLHGLSPKDLSNPKIDPLLKTALTTTSPPDTASWSRDWALSKKSLPAPWAINFQERLLAQAIRLASPGKPLPNGFPAKPDNPSPLWGKLRLMALLQAGQLDAALEQAKSLKPDSGLDLLEARLFLARKEWSQALAVAGLPKEAKEYLVRVLFDSATLTQLCASGTSAWKSEACLILAARDAEKGQWKSGADRLLASQANRAVLWREAATLASDTSPTGLLNWARFLRAHQGKLFFEPDTTWHRSLNFRLSELKSPGTESAPSPSALPWSPNEESQAIQNYFLGSSELFYALKAYAAWLKAAGPKDKNAAKVLQEADKTYNGLINWDNWNSPFWEEYLKNSEWAVTIREAGKSIRNKS